MDNLEQLIDTLLVTASAIEKVHDDFEDDIRKVQLFLEVAKEILRG